MPAGDFAPDRLKLAGETNAGPGPLGWELGKSVTETRNALQVRYEKQT